MRTWYKISQEQPLAQEWITAVERTFDLSDFGRVKFRFKGYSPDGAGRDTLIFVSSPDPSLSEYYVRVRLDLNRGRVDIVVQENGNYKGMQTVQVNQSNLMQSPYQIMQIVRTMIDPRSDYGRQEAGPQSRVAKRVRN